MKVFKKISAFVLVFTFLLTQSVAFSFEATLTDVQGTVYEKAVNKLVELGIVCGYEDNTFRPNELVNRSEVASLMIKIMDKNNMVYIAKGETPFNDVSENHWATGYINLVNQLGIMNGNGDRTFSPDNAVSYREIVKLLVTALGYENSAINEGGYPDGYIKIANDIGITKDLKAEKDELITRGKAAILLYNTLFIDVMECTGIGKDKLYSVVNGKNFASIHKSNVEHGFYDYMPSYGSSGGGSGITQGASISKSAEYPSYAMPLPSATPYPPIYDYPPQYHNTEEYSAQNENSYQSVLANPLSTFSIDVDTASYSNVRRMIDQGTMPTKDAVRIEELINYFKYDYPKPNGDTPFSVYTELSKCPWNDNHSLALINLKGKEIDMSNLPPNNLVFLIDISGSMTDYNKLPLLKQSLMLLTDQLRPQDKISIVVYASTTGVYLDSIDGNEKATIKSAITNLKSGGSTAGASGISLAYDVARKNFIENGNNRIILGTDGDFNVGASSESALLELIEKNRNDGIFLSVLGYGMGNIKDNKMELLADKGNGNYSYIDNLTEAKKVLVEQASGTLFTIAKDFKLQIEFNPSKVKEYRLIGYENRLLNKEDFNNDKIDAGEMGAGHTVTALYELVMSGSSENNANVDDLKYQSTGIEPSDDLMTVKLRYKEPTGTESKLITKAVSDFDINNAPSDNFKFASAVAEFGLLLKNSEYKGNAEFDRLINRAKESIGYDPDGYRAEFISLAELAKLLYKN